MTTSSVIGAVLGADEPTLTEKVVGVLTVTTPVGAVRETVEFGSTVIATVPVSVLAGGVPVPGVVPVPGLVVAPPPAVAVTVAAAVVFSVVLALPVLSVITLVAASDPAVVEKPTGTPSRPLP